jgi:hypothetical protein
MHGSAVATLFLAAPQRLQLLRTHETFNLLLCLLVQLVNFLLLLLWGERAVAANRFDLTVGTLVNLTNLRHH